MSRARAIILIAFATLALVGVAFACRSNCCSRAEICTRYTELRAAISSADTNAVLALLAPDHRSSFDGGKFMRLDGFARPLGARSKVLILGAEATVWPKPKWYVCGVVPIGDTVEVMKVDGRWFFTGNVHLD
jgi:hypothetical protein